MTGKKNKGKKRSNTLRKKNKGRRMMEREGDGRREEKITLDWKGCEGKKNYL